MTVELKVPSAGESITEVMVVEWHKSVGDFVEADETVVEIETDKASMEVPAPVSGTLTKQFVEAGGTAAPGDLLAEFEPGKAPAGANDNSAKAKPVAAKPAAGDSDQAAATTTESGAASHVMPAAQRLLAEHGLEATQVKATGPGGRLLKEDVQRHIAGDDGRKAPKTESPAAPPTPAGPRHEEVVPMTMMRRRIAERLVDAQHTAAMLTTFNEVDMSAILSLRATYKEPFEKKYGIKLGFMSFFVKAAIDALKLVPAVNSEIRGTDVVYKNYYDVGVAVSTDKGLVVPVLRNAERLSFAEIEVAIAELAARARDRKLELDELQGGTFTITNGGIFGSLLSTPILNPPQSGILGMHAINKRPMALDDQVVIRPMMYVALTYDHRVIDGREAVMFLKRIKECIEDPSRMLMEV